MKKDSAFLEFHYSSLFQYYHDKRTSIGEIKKLNSKLKFSLERSIFNSATRYIFTFLFLFA